MTIVFGDAIRKTIRKTLCRKGDLKLAVAYWGDDALNILGMSGARRRLKVLCDLASGLSAPSVIRRLGSRARNLPGLHAKVYWTPAGAVVGSANASKNALGLGSVAKGRLIEAAVHVTNRADIDQIRIWFDALWRRAATIKPSDLALAEVRRAEIQGAQGGTRRGRRLPALLSMLKSNPDEFKNRRIYLCLYNEGLSKEALNVFSKIQEKRKKRRLKRTNYAVKVGYKGCYENWNVPRETVIIDHRIGSRSVDVNKVARDAVTVTFTYKDGTRGKLVPCQAVPIGEFPFALPKADKQRIVQLGKKLMKLRRGKGDADTKIISLFDARHLLARQ